MKIVMKVFPECLRDFLDGSCDVLRNVVPIEEYNPNDVVEIHVDSNEVVLDTIKNIGQTNYTIKIRRK